MKPGKLLLAVALIVVGTLSAFCQDDPNIEFGFKPFGSYHGGDLDTVNLSKGILNLHIPLMDYPQRGALSYAPFVQYMNSGWSVTANCSTQTGVCQPRWVWKGKGVTLNTASPDSFAAGQQPLSKGSTILVYRAGTYDGAQHLMANNLAGGEETLDGTAIWYDGTASPNTGTARNSHGLIANASGLQDTNGNFFSPSLNGIDLVDTVGRNIPITNDSVTTDFSGCTGPLPITTAQMFLYPGYGGTVRQLKVCRANIAFQTNFQESGFFNGEEYPIAEGQIPDASMIQSIVLYNGTNWSTSLAWTFEYNSRSTGDSTSINYGELSKITLPTGGSLSYTWKNLGPDCDPTSGVTSCNRVVSTRTIDADDGTGGHTWQYNGGIVTDPDLNDTVHIFTALAANSSYETQTLYYQGSHQSGQLLKTVKTDYQWMANPFDTLTQAPLPTATNVFPIRTTTIWPSGKTSKIEKTYDNNFVFTVPGAGQFTGSYGEVLETREYGYGDNGVAGPLVRRTVNVYKAFDGSTQASAFFAANMLDRLASVTTYDGNGNQIAQVKYGYDEFPLQPASVTMHLATVPQGTSRGNRTSESHWLNTTNTFITTNTTYYATGEVYQVTDPGGHVTTHFYSSGFQSGVDFAGSLLTKTQDALQHTSYFDYDLNTGLQTTTKDPNSIIANSTYDAFDRMTQKSVTGGPSVNWTFTDSQPPSFTVSSTITSTTNHTSEGDMDGLGRGVHTKITSDPLGTDTADTTYDTLGRVATVSNPHRSGSSLTDGITTSVYDALGRVTKVIHQDGSVTASDYSQYPLVTVTDPAGNQRQSRTDAMGHLVEVDEPGVVNSVQNNTLTFQSGGNVVLNNSANTALWATNTAGVADDSFEIQDDGNLQLYVDKWQAGTYAAPSAGPFSTPACSVGWAMNQSQFLFSGQCLSSPHGQYKLLMQSDGNLVLFNMATSGVTWSSGTGGHPGAYADLQPDGNFVVYNSGGTAGLWATNTNANGNRLELWDNGLIVIFRTVWSSNTSQGTWVGSMAPPSCSLGNILGKTGAIGQGQCFASPNGRYELILQPDGNLMLYDRLNSPATTLWSTGTAVTPFSPGVAMQTLYSYDTLGNLTCVEQHGNAATGTGCSAPPTSDATSPWRVRRFTYNSLSQLLTAHNPESGTITYSYDIDGNLLQKTSPAPNQTGTATQTVSFCYDVLHRMTGKGYGVQSCPLSSPVVIYAYDSGANALGKLTSLTDQAGSASYTYDTLGRLSTETRTLNTPLSPPPGADVVAVSKSLSYEYNLDGSLKALHYPSGAVVTYTPDAAGHTVSAVDSGNGINYATSAAYAADGSLTGFISGNSATFAGVSNAYTYNKRLQPVTMSASAPGQTIYSIGYDFHLGNGTTGSDNGNIYHIYNYRDRDRDQTFTYDALNRLTSAQNAGTDCNQMTVNSKTKYWGNSYSYDAWGNVLNKTITKCGAENLGVTADAHNWIHATGTDYQYDAAGNMTYDATAHLNYSFDQENRISGANGYGYVYDADGNRVRKSNGTLAANGTLYWYMTPGIVAESDLAGTTTSEYVFFGGERVARRDGVNGAGGVFYYFSDHLKTASVITDAAGTIKAESDYYPWGGELQFTNNDSNHYKFTGKERDSETGLDYFGARYYSNGLARWVSADWSPTPIPVPYADLGDPRTLNLYSYVRNNSISLADIDGHQNDDPNAKVGERINCSIAPLRCEQIRRQQNRVDNAIFAHAVVKTVINTLADLGDFGNMIACKLDPSCKTPKVGLHHLSPSNAEEARTMGQLGIAMLAIPGEGEEVGAAKVTSLYARFSKEGEFLKWGISDTPLTRYTQAELAGGKLEIVTQGSREQMMRLERWLTERAPGPLNLEKWAGAKYSERGLRAVEKVLDKIWKPIN